MVTRRTQLIGFRRTQLIGFPRWTQLIGFRWTQLIGFRRTQSIGFRRASSPLVSPWSSLRIESGRRDELWQSVGRDLHLPLVA